MLKLFLLVIQKVIERLYLVLIKELGWGTFLIAYNFMPIDKMHYLPKSKDGHLVYFKDPRNLCRTCVTWLQLSCMKKSSKIMKHKKGVQNKGNNMAQMSVWEILVIFYSQGIWQVLVRVRQEPGTEQQRKPLSTLLRPCNLWWIITYCTLEIWLWVVNTQWYIQMMNNGTVPLKLIQLY